MLRFLLCLLFIAKAMACTEPGQGFLPANDLRYPVEIKDTGLTELEYNDAIDKVKRVYYPIIKQMGVELVMERKWESEVVNAGTNRSGDGKTWYINLYGGFARHPSITTDGYMLVICHEIGHHIGGAPKKFDPVRGPFWSSTEGQADYFATLKCLRKVFRHDNNREIVQGLEIPENVRSECALSFKTEWEVALCMRTSMAGLAVAKVNASIRRVPMPALEIIDPQVVELTRNEHPEPQCRLNTYFQGSVCPVSSTRKVSQINETQGTCQVFTGHTRGLRPACWYKPQK